MTISVETLGCYSQLGLAPGSHAYWHMHTYLQSWYVLPSLPFCLPSLFTREFAHSSRPLPHFGLLVHSSTRSITSVAVHRLAIDCFYGVDDLLATPMFQARMLEWQSRNIRARKKRGKRPSYRNAETESTPSEGPFFFLSWTLKSCVPACSILCKSPGVTRHA